MRYKKLGNSAQDVSIIGLGTMTWGEQNSRQEAFQQMDYAMSKGVNLGCILGHPAMELPAILHF